MPADRVPNYTVNLQNPDGSTNLTWWRYWAAIAGQFSGIDPPVAPLVPPALPPAANVSPATRLAESAYELAAAAQPRAPRAADSAALDLAALAASRSTAKAIDTAALDLAAIAASRSTAKAIGIVNPMTTLGDVIVGAASGVPARLAVGTNGQVPMANSSATDGIDWEAPISLTTTGASGPATYTPGNPPVLNVPQYSGGGGAVVLIGSSVLSAPAVTVAFNAISGGYNHLRLVIIARSANAGTTTENIWGQFNGDTAAHYSQGYAAFVNATGQGVNIAQTKAGIGLAAQASCVAGYPAITTVDIPGYALTTFNKVALITAVSMQTGTLSTAIQNDLFSFFWASSAAITSILLGLSSGANFVTGSAFYLYGIT